MAQLDRYGTIADAVPTVMDPTKPVKYVQID